MRRSLLALGLLLATAPAFAAMQAKPIEWKVGKDRFSGYLVYDDASKDVRPGLVMVPNWMGVTKESVERAKAVAGDDYVILVADVYGADVRPKTPDEAGQATKNMYEHRSDLRARINAALDALKRQVGKAPLDGRHWGAFGFCFGGATVLDLARSGADVGGVVSFHGNLKTDDPSLAKNIKAKVLVLHGADDKFETPEDIANFQKEMRDANVDWQFLAFGGAVHCFAIPKADNTVPGCLYNERAAKRGERQMHMFFDEVFAAR